MRISQSSRAVILAYVLVFSVCAAAGQSPPRARLTWDVSGQVTDLAAPLPDWVVDEAARGPTHYETTLHLTVSSAQPVDSLGFFVRWAAADSTADFRLLGIQGGDGASLSETQTGAMVRDSLDGLDVLHVEAASRLSADALERVAAQDASGGFVYPLDLRIAFRGDGPLRVQAAMLSVRLASGETVLVGDPAVSLADGWRLLFPPLVLEVVGRLNKYFIASRLSLRGLDLDRLVTYYLIDAQDHIRYAGAVERVSDRRIDVTVHNSVIPVGPCDLVYWGADGTQVRLVAAVNAAYLAGSLPGDSNLGVKPGSDE